MQMKETKYSLNEQLSVEMTNLSNERTFLAYRKTFMVLLSSAIVILKILSDLKLMAYALLVVTPFILIIGIVRFFQVKKVIKKMTDLQ